MDSSKFKTFVLWETPLRKKWKVNHTLGGKNILSTCQTNNWIYTLKKDWYSEYINNSYKSLRKTKRQMKKGAKELNRHFIKDGT